MLLLRCPHCGIKVAPTAQGQCPSCRKHIEGVATDVVSCPDFFVIENIHFDPDQMTVALPTKERPANFECVKQVHRMTGDFREHNPLNVPGPFYGAMTDTCETGPIEAPDNVMLDSNGQEFLFKQPVRCEEVQAVILAATCDPFGGYGADGNEHWNLTLVREWWRGRDGIREWIAQEMKVYERWTDLKGQEPTQLIALRAYQRHLKERVEQYLRFYTFYLLESRLPQTGEPLPDVN